MILAPAETVDPALELTQYREAVLTLLNDGLGVVTLAFSLIVLLLAVMVVRHW